MSWFTENIRDPIVKQLAGSGSASPATETANPTPNVTPVNTVTQSPFFVPGILVALVLVFFVFKKG